MIRFGTFCTGIDAPGKAWADLGWEPIWSSEIEQFCCRLLDQRFPGVSNYGDMLKVNPNELKRPDVVCAGTPCQSFSVAGLRGGLDDVRGNLALRFVELIGEIRPQRMVWENVPGILSSWSDEETFAPSEESRRLIEADGLDPNDFVEVEQTNDFDQFTSALVQRGYSLAWGILDAQYFGLAQRRERVFVVGSLGNWTDPAAILFDRESLSGNPAPSRATGQGFTPEIAPSIGASGRGFERAGETRGQDPVIASPMTAGYAKGPAVNDGPKGSPQNLIVCPLTGNQYGDHESRESLWVAVGLPNTSPAIKSRDYKGPSSDGDGDGAILVPMVSGGIQNSGRAAGSATQQDAESDLRVVHTLRADGFDASEDGTGRGTPIIPILESGKRCGTRNSDRDGIGIGQPGDPMFTLQSGAQHDLAFDTTQITSKTNRSNPKMDDPCHTLARGANAPAVLGAMRVRRLTPTECERLQGFPDNWTAIIHNGKPAADGPRYRAIGNSMAVPVLRWIGERINAMEATK